MLRVPRSLGVVAKRSRIRMGGQKEGELFKVTGEEAGEMAHACLQRLQGRTEGRVWRPVLHVTAWTPTW